LGYGYTGVRGYHPLLAVAAGTGDVLMARLRGGNANTARGAAHFLTETIGRVRQAGASGALTVRADSGFYAHAVVAVCRWMKARFSITVRLQAKLHALIEAIPEADWTPIPYWMAGGADVAETTYTPFADSKDAVPFRLIVRRTRPTPGSQLALFATYQYHAFITRPGGGDPGARSRSPPPRRDRERDPRPQVQRRLEPPALGEVCRERGLARGPGDRPQPCPLDGPHRPQGGDRDDQDPPPAAVQPARAAHPLSPPGHPPPARPLAMGRQLHRRPGDAPGDPASHT